MKLRNKKTGKNVDYAGIHITNYDGYGKMIDSITELNDECEDYTPVEPLIKDKEIRNMVRLWQKIHNADILRYLELFGVDGHYLEGGL